LEVISTFGLLATYMYFLKWDQVQAYINFHKPSHSKHTRTIYWLIFQIFKSSKVGVRISVCDLKSLSS